MQFISEKGCTRVNALFSDWLNGSAFCRQSYANLKKLATTVKVLANDHELFDSFATLRILLRGSGRENASS
jgi:hypothetical protein